MSPTDRGAALAALLRDLDDESAALDAVVADLEAAALDLPTPAEGWSVRDALATWARPTGPRTRP